MGKSVLSSLSSKVFVSEPTILQNRKALGLLFSSISGDTKINENNETTLHQVINT